MAYKIKDTQIWVHNLNRLIERDERCLTRIAADCGFSVTHLHNLKNGDTLNCGVQTFASIAKAFNLTLDELYYTKIK